MFEIGQKVSLSEVKESKEWNLEYMERNTSNPCIVYVHSSGSMDAIFKNGTQTTTITKNPRSLKQEQ